MMETVFYDDYNSAHNSFLSAGMNNINQLKRKLTLNLDFTSGDGINGNSKQTSVIKKAKVASISLNTPNSAAILNSPDLHMLKLASPELERLIIQQTSLLPTPTPTNQSHFFPKNVTEEQEQYARGFTEALTKLKSQHESTQAITTSSNNNNNPNIITTSSSNINTSVHNNLTGQQMSNISVVSSHQVINNSQHLMQITPNLNQVVHQQPPPPYYDPDSSELSEDSMSENSCSNSTTSSSTYTTNGHVLVPPSSILSLNSNSAQGQHGFPVTSASMMHHHRLPDYQINQLGSGSTAASGTATIPVPAANYPHLSHSPHLGVIKEEPQTVPNVSASAPVSPIDMASQEKIKLERKRQRNRVAASKCRKRKLERISKLEDKVKQLKGENSDLTTVLGKLKETVCVLKQQVMEHLNSGCHIAISQSMNSTL